jgi:hypothetical protein
MENVTLTLTVDQASWLYCILHQVPAPYQNSKTETLIAAVAALPYPEEG